MYFPQSIYSENRKLISCKRREIQQGRQYRRAMELRARATGKLWFRCLVNQLVKDIAQKKLLMRKYLEENAELKKLREA